MASLQPKIITDVRCELGEGPIWDPDKNCLYWTDISAGKIFRLHWPSQQSEVIYHDVPVGGFTLQENGDLLLFRVSDIALLQSDGTVRLLKEFQDTGMERFNDVIADPSGRVFAGTSGKTFESGGLYRVDLDGNISKLFDGTGCSNGMGFSPDLKTFYWTCSTTKRIFKFDYEKTSGVISNRQLFYEAKPDEGIPDGLTVDAEGCVWSARWGGFSIKRHSANGEVISSFSFPVRNVSSLCFGGGNLDELFVTTAQEPGENSETAGALFHISAAEKGRAEFRSGVVIIQK